jgi:outer membrane protein assembly factor BamB
MDKEIRIIRALAITTLLTVVFTSAAFALDAVQAIRSARITGGLIAQAGSDDLALKELGGAFHVRLLLPDAGAVAKAQDAIDRAGLQGRFTVSQWDGKSVPFAERTLNALVLAKEGMVGEAEVARALAPRGLLISPAGVKPAPVPQTIDDWTHFLHNASGNAVSKDKEVASPRSLRWRADPKYSISHSAPASLLGMVSDHGRILYLLNETSYLFEKTGIVPERWFLVARDAFNGAELWRRSLAEFGQNTMEEVGMQPGPGTWRTPMNLNRRVVAIGGRVYATLGYRGGALSILDAATGETLREIDGGGVIDEIIADEERAVCRVRPAIPLPADKFTADWSQQAELKKQGIENPAQYVQEKLLDSLKTEGGQELVAVEPARGKVLWRHPAKSMSHRSLAMAGGKVVYHDYEGLVALDAATGKQVWRFPTPWKEDFSLSWWRAYFGDLLIAEGKVYWAGAATGGFVVNLDDGTLVWEDKNLSDDRGFTHPLAIRVIAGKLYGDANYWFVRSFADGKPLTKPDMGDMLKRGHHVRCYPGKATERFLILPMRGAEFVDIQGDQHMVNDWLRGSCSYGLMPANGLLYNTPDPCSCYAGARIPGLMALAAKLPAGLEQATPLEDDSRLEKGPAYGGRQKAEGGRRNEESWPIYMANPARTSFAATSLAAQLAPAWTSKVGGELTQATIAGGKVFLVRKDRYELVCFELANGKTLWVRSFPAALDGPPTIVGHTLLLGCRNGRVYSLAAEDGRLAWSRLVAPMEHITLGDGRIENTWPAFSSLLHHNGLIYATAGNNSYLDGGIRLAALDPATGEIKHHTLLEGPWPDKQTLRTAVIGGDGFWQQKPEERKDFDKVNEQYATGYHILGGQADLLVAGADGQDLYMSQNKFAADLKPIPLRRAWHTGFTPMGGMHILANFGLLDDSMFSRTSRMYNDAWPSYGSGPGSAARGGTVVAVGKERAYAAQHFIGGGYPMHKPGAGNRIVADALDIKNLPGDLVVAELDEETRKKEGIDWTYTSLGAKSISRTRKALWTTPTPVIVRSLLAAPDGQGGELVFAAGVVEGKSVAEWDKSIYFDGPGKLQVFEGKDGKLLAEYDLPACPVFDGMSAADGTLLIPMVNGQVHSLVPKNKTQP